MIKERGFEKKESGRKMVYGRRKQWVKEGEKRDEGEGNGRKGW